MYNFSRASEVTYRTNGKNLLINCSINGGDMESYTTNILQNIIKINISNIQQTQHFLKTIIDKLLYTFVINNNCFL